MSDFRGFRRIVRSYYLKHARPMPWRRTRDPYRILVSEIMLQQTQVNRVIDKYRLFIRRFSTIDKLASAKLRDVLGAWQGLGYNRRALLLKRLAEEVVLRHAGRLPREREVLGALPGIGKATEGSMMAFAFNRPVTFIETNIRSVYIHHFFSGRSDVGDDEIMPYVEKTVDRVNPREWYYALMDYGVYLKSVTSNPSRKSRHYSRQSPFKGSDREIRGQVLRLLTERARMTEEALFGALRGDASRKRKIVAALEREGLVRRTGRHLTI